MGLKNGFLIPEYVFPDFLPDRGFGNQVDLASESLFQGRLEIADVEERERRSGFFLVDDVEVARVLSFVPGEGSGKVRVPDVVPLENRPDSRTAEHSDDGNAGHVSFGFDTIICRVAGLPIPLRNVSENARIMHFT